METKKNEAQIKRELEKKRIEFLQANAIKIDRTINKPSFFYMTNQEMNGKFGWFNSIGKNYNMIEYYTGWEFNNEKTKQEFLNIQ
jgi:hypothetical protein